jgi:hypothetical protein
MAGFSALMFLLSESALSIENSAAAAASTVGALAAGSLSERASWRRRFEARPSDAPESTRGSDCWPMNISQCGLISRKRSRNLAIGAAAPPTWRPKAVSAGYVLSRTFRTSQQTTNANANNTDTPLSESYCSRLSLVVGPGKAQRC